jgi:hypothetical protein
VTTNNIVRVTEDRNNLVRPWLELHQWWTEWEAKSVIKGNFGAGPFVAVATGQNFFDAIGGGLMIGRKFDGQSNWSMNLAVGGALELNAKVLGDGIKANQPLPEGDTTARTKTTTVGSLLVMFSVAWSPWAGTVPTPKETAAGMKKLNAGSSGVAWNGGAF